MSDQWKEEGNCEICRRRNYCRKMCSVRKRKYKEALSQYLKQRIAMGLLEKPAEGVSGDDS